MTNAGLGAVARDTSGETLLWTGAASTLLTDASASAAETEEIMRVKENISRTLNKKGRGCKRSRLADLKNVKAKASKESGGEVPQPYPTYLIYIRC